MLSLPSEGEYPIEPVEVRFTCYPNLMFLAFPYLEIIDFQTSYFSDFEQFQIDSHFADFWVYLFSFTYFEQVTVILLCLDKMLDPEN